MDFGCKQKQKGRMFPSCLSAFFIKDTEHMPALKRAAVSGFTYMQ